MTMTYYRWDENGTYQTVTITIQPRSMESFLSIAMGKAGWTKKA